MHDPSNPTPIPPSRILKKTFPFFPINMTNIFRLPAFCALPLVSASAAFQDPTLSFFQQRAPQTAPHSPLASNPIFTDAQDRPPANFKNPPQCPASHDDTLESLLNDVEAAVALAHAFAADLAQQKVLAHVRFGRAVPKIIEESADMVYPGEVLPEAVYECPWNKVDKTWGPASDPKWIRWRNAGLPKKGSEDYRGGQGPDVLPTTDFSARFALFAFQRQVYAGIDKGNSWNVEHVNWGNHAIMMGPYRVAPMSDAGVSKKGNDR